MVAALKRASSGEKVSSAARPTLGAGSPAMRLMGKPSSYR